MVGLSIVLETTTTSNNTLGDGVISPKPHQVVNKSTVMVTAIASSAAATTDMANFRRGRSWCTDSGFLEHCFLCRRKLLPAKDIYMYKGDRAFCSVECRSKQMIMDEEETLRREYSSLKAVEKIESDLPVPAPSCHRRVWRGGFAY